MARVCAAFDSAQRRRIGGDHNVAAENEIGAAGSDADRRDIFRGGRDPDMAHHGAVFLRQAGEVQRRAAATV